MSSDRKNNVRQRRSLTRTASSELSGKALTGSEDSPPVSVIMAVYNGERYVTEAIGSVLRQTHESLELIIVNDASTDRTQEILDRYAGRDRRVKIIVQPENMDQPASLNVALSTARHEWVAVIDADDIWMSHRLETQLHALRELLQHEPLVRVLGAYAINIDRWGREQGLKAVGPRSVAESKEIVEHNGWVTIVHPSALMHRPTILQIGGYDPEFGPSADSELWSRVCDRHLVVALTEPLLYYRVHPDSMSATRFFEQRLTLRWILARQHARRRRHPQPTLKEFRMLEGSLFSCRRRNLIRQDWGQYLLMSSGMAWRERRWLKALLLRVAAITLVPLEVLGRVRLRNIPKHTKRYFDSARHNN